MGRGSTIRILWFVNSIFPEVAQELSIPASGGGWWLVALANELRKRTDVELAIATSSLKTKSNSKFRHDNVQFYVREESLWARNLKKIGRDSLESVVKPSLEIVDDFSPDVIVSHGTENGYGLLAPHVGVPVLVELQGILNGYLPHFWGDITNPIQRLLYPRAMRNWLSMRRRAKNERKVFKLNQFFSGRTEWDRSQLFKFNPDATYFTERRVLRPEFRLHQWSLDKVNRNTIYTTTTPHFLKGTACLIEAIALVKRLVPDVRLKIGGLDGSGEVGGFLKRKIKHLGLQNAVEFAGYLSSSKIVACLCDTHVYVIPSHIENSPNNLAEALAVGTPTVASSAGGIPSMMKHDEEGLLFNSGDSAMLAYSLFRLLNDDKLINRLSENARVGTLQKHDSVLISNTHIENCRIVADSRC